MNTKSMLKLLESEANFIAEEQARMLSAIETLDSRLGSLQAEIDALKAEILCGLPE